MIIYLSSPGNAAQAPNAVQAPVDSLRQASHCSHTAGCAASRTRLWQPPDYFHLFELSTEGWLNQSVQELLQGVWV